MLNVEMLESGVLRIEALELGVLESGVLEFQILGLEMLKLGVLRLGEMKLEIDWFYRSYGRELGAGAYFPGKGLCSDVYPERNPMCYEVHSQGNLRSGMHFWRELYLGMDRRS